MGLELLRAQGRALSSGEKFQTMRRLEWLWQLLPNQRLGQLLVNSIGESNLFNIEDKRLVEAVESFVQKALLGSDTAEERLRLALGDERFEWYKARGGLKEDSFLQTLALWAGRSPELPDNRDVHTEHCCIGHGCKYSNDDCTVVTRKKVQTWECYECHEERNEYE